MKRASRLRKLEASLAGRAPAPLAQGANLYRSVEEQIAVVRGRAPGQPSRGLLLLEERLLAPTRRVEAAVQRLDDGQVSPPGPAPGPAPMPVRTAAAAAAFSAPAAWEPAAFAGPVSVEPFGFAEPVYRRPCCCASAPVATPAQALTVSPERATCRIEAAPEAPARAASSRWASADERRSRPPRLSQPQQAATEAFERDLAALLGEAKAQAPEDADWNTTVSQAGPTAAAPPAAPAPAAASGAEPPTTPPPPKLDHSIFDQMGSAMRYANSFDLGAVDLGARFDAFERELIPSAPARTRPLADARALNDFDVVADLAELGDPGHRPSAGMPPAAALDAPVPEPVASDGSTTSQETCHG